ncbi:hypothetical protein [Blastococcus sp. SYSU DS0533]
MDLGPGGRGSLLTGTCREPGAATARALVIGGPVPRWCGSAGTDHLTGTAIDRAVVPRAR